MVGATGAQAVLHVADPEAAALVLSQVGAVFGCCCCFGVDGGGTGGAGGGVVVVVVAVVVGRVPQ